MNRYKLVVFLLGCFLGHLNAQVSGDSASLEKKTSEAKKDTGKIQAVEIKVQRSIIENQADKLVYNASEDITSQGQSASDLLAKVPMVDVDMDGNVSLRGNRNVRFLVNGRPSGLISGSPADALRALSADDIERIEVITNPSSKYDADGSGGIINIIMKKKIVGNTGNLRLGIGTRSAHFGGQYSSVRGKNNFSASAGGHFWRSWGDVVTTRTNVNTLGENWVLKQNGYANNWGGGPRITLNLDRQIDDKQSLVLTVGTNSQMRSNKQDWTNLQGLSALQKTSDQSADRFNFGMGYDLGFDYRKKFDKKDREFSISGLMAIGTGNDDYLAKRDFYGIIVTNEQEQSLNSTLNNETSLQVDYTEPFTQAIKGEFGAKAIFRTVNSDYLFSFYNDTLGDFIEAKDRTNGLEYYQNVYAAYGQLNYSFAKKYSVRFGLRYEMTEFGGALSQSQKSEFKGDPYANLVPSFNISRSIGKGGFARFNYNRRIQRPSLFYLNPYVNTSDPLNVSQGNPYLSPEFGDNFEFSFGNYTKVGGYGFNIFHKRVDQAIETYRTVNANDIYVTTYGNFGLNRQNGFDFNVNFRGKGWSLFFNGGAGLVQISTLVDSGAIAGLSVLGVTYSAGLRGNVKLGKHWMLEAFSRVNAPSFSLQGYSQNWLFHTIGFKRQFKNDQGGIGFGFDNPFSPVVHLKTENQGNGFTYLQDRELNMWGVRINFDYKLGKISSQPENIREIKIKNEDLKNGDGQGGM
jgi:outer membrane receptor protein involved in Fe transport